MPVQIAELPKTKRGRESKYDFSKLFDGKAYLLVQGTEDEVKANKADFSCQPDSLRQTLYRVAHESNVDLSTRLTEHDGRPAVAVQRVEKKAQENGNKQAGQKAEAKTEAK